MPFENADWRALGRGGGGCTFVQPRSRLAKYKIRDNRDVNDTLYNTPSGILPLVGVSRRAEDQERAPGPSRRLGPGRGRRYHHAPLRRGGQFLLYRISKPEWFAIR